MCISPPLTPHLPAPFPAHGSGCEGPEKGEVLPVFPGSVHVSKELFSDISPGCLRSWGGCPWGGLAQARIR